MATKTGPQTQITTADPEVAAAPVVPIPTPAPAPSAPGPSPETGSERAAGQAPTAEHLQQRAAPPSGAYPGPPANAASQQGDTGLEGEQVIWEARYSLKNFIGRLVGMGLLTVAWIALAAWAWGIGASARYASLTILTTLAGIVLGIMWLALLRRIVLARFGHFYRLTDRRLFVMTGVFNRRRDQMELLKLDDVFTRQNITGRMFGVGTVVATSKEPQRPIMYLTGVDDPKSVMDLVWHHARAERDRTSVEVNQI